uniref:Integrase core domain containing protein n=1 Tax=Solanum tuberosum TaxID=4113 RepID=M1APM8_SOLTU
MARDPGTYSEEIVPEFYASYAATLRGSISKRSKPIAQDPLTSTMVRGCPVDISHATISRFLYGPITGHSWSLNTTEFDYRWDIVRSGAFQRNAEQREAIILWLAKYIVADGERAECVATPWLGIRKATINFMAKFFSLLVRNRVSPTKTDNQLTWDRVVMVAALVAGVEIDFARMLLAEIHKRALKTSTTYPFSCLIFQLCRDSGVPIWHCDRLIHPTGTLDISLIRDEANVVAPRRDPQVEVPPLGADLADTVGQAQGSDPIIPNHTDSIPTSSSQAASRAHSSSRSTPPLGAVVVPLARVQKLEAQMATLLHHIQPWMQNLRADVDDILSTPIVEPQAAPTALVDDTVLDTLFSGTAEEGPEPTHTKGKRHRSSRTEEEKAQKRQRRQEKEARKSLILDEALRQQRVRESIVGASSSTPVVEVQPVVRDVVSTTDGAVRVTESPTEGAIMVDVGTTEGDPRMVPAGSRKPDPPAC